MEERGFAHGTVIASLRSCVLVAIRDRIASLIRRGRGYACRCGRGGLGAAAAGGGGGCDADAVIVAWCGWLEDAFWKKVEGVTDRARNRWSSLQRRKGSRRGIERGSGSRRFLPSRRSRPLFETENVSQ